MIYRESILKQWQKIYDWPMPFGHQTFLIFWKENRHRPIWHRHRPICSALVEQSVIKSSYFFTLFQILYRIDTFWCVGLCTSLFHCNVAWRFPSNATDSFPIFVFPWLRETICAQLNHWLLETAVGQRISSRGWLPVLCPSSEHSVDKQRYSSLGHLSHTLLLPNNGV